LGCGFYRCHLPYKYLSKIGFDVTLTNRLTYPSPELTDIDALVLQRQHNPQVFQIANLVKSQSGGKIVMELDDYFHDIPPNNPARISYMKGSESVQYLEKFMEFSDLMTVSTPGLKENYTKFNKNIWICPNKVEIDSLKTFVANPRTTDEFRLGWAGSGTHHDDLITIVKPISELMMEYKNIKLVFIGQFYKNIFPSYLHPRMENIGHTFPVENGKALFYSKDAVNPVVKYYDLLHSANLHAAIAPLLQVTFNRCKCLDENTKIMTQRGILPLKNVTVEDKVWNQGKWVYVEAIEQTESRIGFTFTTVDGYQITMTPEHRMWVNDKEWKFAKDIVIGDNFTLQPEANTIEDYVYANWPADGRVSRYSDNRFNFKDSVEAPQVKITPVWARIMGAFAGDGCFNAPTIISISCDGQDQDWIDQLINDFNSIGLNPTTEKVQTWDGKIINRRYVKVSSAHLVRFLISMGLGVWNDGHPKRNFKIPDIIWKSPRDVQAAWLSGYFEADGWVSENSAVAVSSKYLELCQDVQRLLLIFGIVSRVYSHQSKSQTSALQNYYRVGLRRAGVDVFAQTIGFQSRRKKDSLKNIIKKPHSNSYKKMQWSQEIVRIEETLVNNPVDIQVEGEVFSAAGFVSHNSFVKLIEYGLAGIPFVATAFGPYSQYINDARSWDNEKTVGLLADRNPEWKKQLKKYIDNEPFRQEVAINNSLNVQANHTIHLGVQKWIEALASIDIHPGDEEGVYKETLSNFT
jgi:intein/homing endonuclease